MEYPFTRMRRNRKSQWLRDIVAEHRLSVKDLIYPLFVIDGVNQQVEVSSMPGVYRLSIDLILDQVKAAHEFGVPAIALFPSIAPELKNSQATEALNGNNLICRAIRAIKQLNLDIGVIADVALDPYTDHGHDGILDANKMVIDNDLTCSILSKQALVLAEAGADIVALSDMMDGNVKSIRSELERHSLFDLGILVYSAKYSSSFYGPFRDAVGVQLAFFGKATYQMDFRNSKEALRQIALDIEEGADMVMIKPAMSYLDIVQLASMNFNVPIMAYQVSGEYAMMKYAAYHGALNWEKVVLESLISIKRAGATGVFTYAALEVAKNLSLV